MIIEPDTRQQETLLQLARASVEYGCEYGVCLPVDKVPGGDTVLCNKVFSQHASTFVTLKSKPDMALRGCIGSLYARQSLVQDVIEHAHAAAFEDSRFSKVHQRELASLHISVSIISPMEAMSFSSEQDFLQQLRPNIDGVLIECHGRRATFLPSVWEQLADKCSFIAHLKQKAGLAEQYWHEDFKAFRYNCMYFQEQAQL